MTNAVRFDYFPQIANTFAHDPNPVIGSISAFRRSARFFASVGGKPISTRPKLILPRTSSTNQLIPTRVVKPLSQLHYEAICGYERRCQRQAAKVQPQSVTTHSSLSFTSGNHKRI